MAFHRGNAIFSGLSATNIRTPWQEWTPTAIDASDYVSVLIDATRGEHASFFRMKNMVIVSLNLRLTVDNSAPEQLTRMSLSLPSGLSVRDNEFVMSQILIERLSPQGVVERRFSYGMIEVDGSTLGGADGLVRVYRDRLFIRNTGLLFGGYEYIVRGQATFAPAV